MGRAGGASVIYRRPVVDTRSPISPGLGNSHRPFFYYYFEFWFPYLSLAVSLACLLCIYITFSCLSWWPCSFTVYKTVAGLGGAFRLLQADEEWLAARIPPDKTDSTPFPCLRLIALVWSIYTSCGLRSPRFLTA